MDPAPTWSAGRAVLSCSRQTRICSGAHPALVWRQSRRVGPAADGNAQMNRHSAFADAAAALDEGDFELLRRAVDERCCREKHGFGTLAEAADLYRTDPACPSCRGLLRERPGALQGDMGGGRALGREGLPQGGGDLLRRRGLGPRLPGVPQGPLGEAQDQQRPGEGEQGDQEALQGRPVLPLGRLDAAPERGLHPLGGGALGHPARLQRGVRRARLQGPRAQGGSIEGEEGGAGEEGRPDRRGDNRDLRPQEGVRFG